MCYLITNIHTKLANCHIAKFANGVSPKLYFSFADFNIFEYIGNNFAWDWISRITSAKLFCFYFCYLAIIVESGLHYFACLFIF